MKLGLYLFCLTSCPFIQAQSSVPNIIFILADDLGKKFSFQDRSYSIETFKKFFNHYYYDNSAGFNDIGFRNPAVITPNIDQLARDGVILNRNYVQAICTPSRSSLMTGIYPYKIGRQVF